MILSLLPRRPFMKYKACVLLFFFSFSQVLNASLDYSNGKDLQTRYSYLPFIANSSRVEVPIDHNQPHSGHFSLYSHFLRPYNSKKSTLIYLTSMFGQSIHTMRPSLVQYLQSLDYNILLIEPRGVGFSKPDSQRTQNSYQFFTLEAMAHDIEYVRKANKLNSVTLMSSGFSSSIAQIYAHFYPQFVKNIVMENPVFLSKNGLQTNPNLLNAASNYLQTLKPEILEKVKSLNLLDPTGQDHWLLAIIKMILTNHHPEKLNTLTELLERYNNIEGLFYVYRIQLNLTREIMTDPISNIDYLEPLIDFQIHHYMGYQYFNAYTSQSKLRWHFSPKGNIQQSPLKLSDLTGPLFKKKPDQTETFSYQKYPIKIPVQIIYGGLDLYALQPSTIMQGQETEGLPKGYVIEVSNFGRNPLLQIHQNENLPYSFKIDNKTVLKTQKWLVVPLLNAKKFKTSDQKNWDNKFPKMPVLILNHNSNASPDCNSSLEEE